ncbi:hypothetical protein MZO24_016780, partial [Enterococcus faecalis]|nr:hypothetical protein [Enterococcus faecalis]
MNCTSKHPSNGGSRRNLAPIDSSFFPDFPTDLPAILSHGSLRELAFFASFVAAAVISKNPRFPILANPTFFHDVATVLNFTTLESEVLF